MSSLLTLFSKYGKKVAVSVPATISYILRDEFTTNQSAPLSSPRTCEPGPGNLTLVDTGNKVSIVGQNLRVSVGLSNSDPRIYSAIELARVAGLSFTFKQQIQAQVGVAGAVGLSRTTAAWVSNFSSGIIWLSGLFQVFIGSSSFSDSTAYPFLTGTQYQIFLIMRATKGSIVLVKGGVYTNWTLFFVDTYDTDGGVFPHCGAGTGATNFDTDSWKVVQLSSPWDTFAGWATFYSATPSSGDVFAHDADCAVEVIWSVPAASSYDVQIRRTDDDNCWIIRMSSATNTIKLIEKVLGVETERSSAAASYVSGDRVYIVAKGNVIKTVLSQSGGFATKNTYTSASFQNTATQGKISGAGTITDLIAWPLTITGAAASVLDGV